MANTTVAQKEWLFTRPDPPQPDPNGPHSQYFRPDLRKIAGEQQDRYLPWRDDMYLAYPSEHEPDWSAFMRHITSLNETGDACYKVFYILRRAHKGNTTPDLSLDDQGKEQCAQLAANFERAMKVAGLPRPDVIVTSPLTRALETTRRSFPSIRPIVHEALRERMTGAEKTKRRSKEWIKQNYENFDVEKVDADDSLGARYADPTFQELYEATWQRAKDAFVFVFEKFPNASVVLLMSHCHLLQTIQREVTGWDIPEEERKDRVEFYVGEAKGYAMVVKGVSR